MSSSVYYLKLFYLTQPICILFVLVTGMELQTASLPVYTSGSLGLHSHHWISPGMFLLHSLCLYCLRSHSQYVCVGPKYTDTEVVKGILHCFQLTINHCVDWVESCILSTGIPLDTVSFRWPDNKNLELAKSLLCVHLDWTQPLCDVRSVPPFTGPYRLCILGFHSASLGYFRYTGETWR